MNEFGESQAASSAVCMDAHEGHDEPRSAGGCAPVTRRCHAGEHDRCGGGWTAYPDSSGPCECACHGIARAGKMSGQIARPGGVAL